MILLILEQVRMKHGKVFDRVNKVFKFEPGDQVLFKRGDEWTGTLIINMSGATYSLFTVLLDQEINLKFMDQN